MERFNRLWIGACFVMVGVAIISQSVYGKDSNKGGNVLAKVDKSVLTTETFNKQFENTRMPQMKPVTPDMKKEMVE